MEPRLLNNKGQIQEQGQEEKVGMFLLDLASDSSINQGPEGWTITDTGTGDYTVNHNIGHSNYSVFAQSIGTATQVVQVSAKGNTSFDVNAFDAGDGSTAEDAGLQLLVLVHGDADPVA